MAISGTSRGPSHILIKGRNGAGAITYPSAQVGDTVFAVVNITSLGNEGASFESRVSVAGQLQQTSALNLSANEYWVLAVG
jgi:hypothetical protein